ncbi:hypothetical protein EMIT0324P_210009 [Pseudomonas chlororaphis]
MPGLTDPPFGAAGDQACTTSDFHPVQRYSYATDGVGAVTLDYREDTFALWATDLMPNPGNGFSIEISLEEGLKYYPAVAGGVA